MFELLDLIIVRPIINILFIIYNYVGDFGLTIILFTIIVKFLMWPLVKRQFHQTKLMRKIQPELAEIKKNCKGNRQLESLQMMDLYKRYNIKPFRSVFTLFIQLPIYFSLFMAINTMVRPQLDQGTTCGHTNVYYCAYAPVRSLDRIEEITKEQEDYFKEVAAKQENPEAPEPSYAFSPKLFGLVDLNARAGFGSVSSMIVMAFAVAAAFCQYYMSRQQMPSEQSKKSRTFRQLIKETAAGKDPDQADINNMISGQMSYMMPIMMLLLMVNLPGAIVFYYLFSNIITITQQKIILHRAFDDMDNRADKKILKELRDAKKIQEAEIVENKKTGTRITRISAKDAKKGGKGSKRKE